MSDDTETVENQENEEIVLALEPYNTHLIYQAINEESISKAVKFILFKNFQPRAKRPSHLTLFINSEGGELKDAFALIDIMKGSKIPVHTVGIGAVGSCALFIFMAGAHGHRILTPNTSILSHQWSWELPENKMHELIAATKEVNYTQDRLIAHIKHCTKIENETKIHELLLPPHDVWLNSKEAVKYGIADHVVSYYPLPK